MLIAHNSVSPSAKSTVVVINFIKGNILLCNYLCNAFFYKHCYNI